MDEQRKIRRFRDLQIWQKGMQIAKLVYAVTSELPSDERYGLTSQMRRAAVSIPSNIAEGFRYRSKRDFIRFLHMALGSAAELETQIELCQELFHMDRSRDLLEHVDHLQAMTMNLIKELRK